MFIALSEQLGQAEISHKKLREIVVEYLRENRKRVSILIVFLKIKLGLVTKAEEESDAKTERAFRCNKKYLNEKNNIKDKFLA